MNPIDRTHSPQRPWKARCSRDFEPDRYKTDPKKNDKQVDRFAVLGGSQSALNHGRILAEAQNFTRELANEPANLLTPMRMAERAREMAAEQGLECEVLDQDRMRQLGMGALLGVAQGSAEPPALIVMRYKPATPAASKRSSGASRKGRHVRYRRHLHQAGRRHGKDEVRHGGRRGRDLGAMRAIAQLKPAIPVTALIPAVENMPGSRAQRPGDIVTSLSGKTIEVINTDAEGRLIWSTR